MSVGRRRRRGAGSGWYRLPSGLTIHLQADKVPDADAMAALDELAQAVARRMQALKDQPHGEAPED